MRSIVRFAVLAFVVALTACARTSSPASGSKDAGDPFGASGDAANVSDGGTPSLTSLFVSPVALTPAFSPDIHDYYVRCAAGTNRLTVTASAASGATVAVVQPGTSGSAASTLAAQVDVVASQAMVVRAASGPNTTDYWVRCLPHLFPKLQMNSHPSAGAVSPGYYLVGDTSRASTELSYAMVLDGNGVPVWYSTTRTGREPVNVESLSPNVISFVPFFDYTFARSSQLYEVFDLSLGGISYVETHGEPLDAHELQLLANGDYLMISDPIVTGVDLTGLGSFGAHEDIIACNVQEVSPSGLVVWTWVATDHFDPVQDTTWPQTTTLGGATIVDPFHCNSVDVASNGDLLISSRHMDSVFMVSKTTGAVLWKMGGAEYTKEGAPYLTVTDDPDTSFYRQHDARLLPNGQLSMFDDQTDVPGPARGVVYAYDVGARTATFVGQYAGTVSSVAMGSFRVLPDGARLIGWGEGGEPTLAFTEIDSAGHDLLDFNFTDGDESYRALKVPLSQLDLTLMHNAVSLYAGTSTIATSTSPLNSDANDAGANDPGSLDATTSVDASASAGCFAVSGTGANAECNYSSTTVSGATCATGGGSSVGSCPSTGLNGCCVETLSLDGGGRNVTATCYYSATTGSAAATQCASDAGQGMPFLWQTSAP